jgi:hypothetical protein
VDKIGNKNWLINTATLSLPPPLKKGNKFFENKLKFKPKAIKKYSRNFGGKHTSLYLCTPKLKNGKAVIAKDL